MKVYVMIWCLLFAFFCIMVISSFLKDLGWIDEDLFDFLSNKNKKL
jgi:hypothetical protein